jgi:ankyrin repeat protein
MRKAFLLLAVLCFLCLTASILRAGEEVEILDAAKKGDFAEVKALVAKNPALVNSKDDNSNTPLIWAAGGGYKEVVGLLLSRGADINVKNNNGNTPLMGAACMDHKEVAELLISRGADINAKNKDGTTALALAEKCAKDKKLSIENEAEYKQRVTAWKAIADMLHARETK